MPRKVPDGPGYHLPVVKKRTKAAGLNPSRSCDHSVRAVNPGQPRRPPYAPHVVALNRLRRNERTRAYAVRRTSEGKTGKTKKDAMRRLKRYIVARDLPDAAARFPLGRPGPRGG